MSKEKLSVSTYGVYVSEIVYLMNLNEIEAVKLLWHQL